MLKLGLVWKANREILWYGNEISLQQLEELKAEYGEVQDIQMLDCYDELFEGIWVEDVQDLSNNDISLAYYFPDEEGPEDLDEDRLIDLGRVTLFVHPARRYKCEEGNVYICSGELKEDHLSLLHYDTGFLPPMDPKDITILVQDLSDFGLNGYIVGEIAYRHKGPIYLETSERPGIRLKTRVLED